MPRKPPRDQRCNNCHFFVEVWSSEGFPVCCRYPRHEQRHDFDWCGEWQQATGHPIQSHRRSEDKPAPEDADG